MRRVKVFGTAWDAAVRTRSKTDDGEAWFHQFGCDYEEFETGAGNYSIIAIIERDNGTFEAVPANMIKFIGGAV